MRVAVIGATGTIGSAVVKALAGHEVVPVSHSGGDLRVDLGSAESVRALYRKLGEVDAVVSCAGNARFGPLDHLTDEDFRLSLGNKLMGQVNLVRYGWDHVRDGGSFTLTSGVLGRHPVPGSAAVSIVNAGVEAFARAAALEAPRFIRVNAVSPPWVSETLAQMGEDPAAGLPADTVALAYLDSVVGKANGAVLEATAEA